MAKLAMTNEMVASLLDSLRIGLLFLQCLLTVSLEVFLMSHVDIKAMGERGPLSFVDELVGSTAALLLISDDPVVDV